MCGTAVIAAAFCAWRYKRALDALLGDHQVALKELRRVIEENETLRAWLEEMRNEEQEARMEAHMAEEHEKAAIEAVASGLNYVDCAVQQSLKLDNGPDHDQKKCSPR